MPTLFEKVRELAEIQPDKQALIPESGRSRTYGELAERSARLARVLCHELAVPVGARACLLMWNRPEFVEASLASGAAGLSTVPANPQWADAELEFVLRHSGSRVLFCEGEDLERGLALKARLDGLEHVFVAGSAGDAATSLDSLLGAGSDGSRRQLPEVPDSVPGQLMYTSGTTTGRPKAVPMARELMRRGVDYTDMFGIGDADRCIFVTPMFHGNGSGALHAALYYGGSAVFQRRFSARGFWPLVERTDPTLLFTLAPIVHILMGLSPSAAERTHSLRMIIALGSGPAMEAMEKRYAVPVIDWYGMTEAGTGTYTRLDEERRPGSAGRPFPDSGMRIVRDDGSEAPRGEVGEVCFESRSIGFDGYWRDREASEAALCEGWFHTGDLGYFDADGFFYFVDRLKDVVRRGGENISSVEVELVLMDHPDLAEVAVVGKPDAVLGERVVAFAVPSDGARAPDAEELARFARERLAAFKLPEEVHPVESLPRTATGKVQKFMLREQLTRAQD